MIATHLTNHARRQSQRRGVMPSTLDLVLNHSDKSRKLPGQARAVWISRTGRDRLKWGGFAPADIDRTRGVRLIVNTNEDVVVTVEHMLARRAWA